MVLIFILISNSSFASNLLLPYSDLRPLLEKNNQEIQGRAYSVDALEEKTGFIRRSYLPKISAGIGQEKFTTGPYQSLNQSYANLEARINLYNGGRDSLEENKRKAALALGKVQYQQTLFDQLYHLRILYWKTVAAQEQLQNFKMALQLNEDNQKSAQLRIKSGIATQTDSLEFEQNKLELMQQLQKQEIELDNAQREIKAILNLDSSLVLDTLAISPHDEATNVKNDFDYNEQRDVKSLQWEQEIIETNKKQKFRWWTPELDVYAGYSRFTFRERDYLSAKDRDDTVLGFKINFNLFDGGDSFNSAQSYIHEVRSLSARREQAKINLQALLTNKTKYLAVIDNLVHIAEENTKKSQQYFNNTIAEYKRGIKNSVDVLQASNRLISSRNEWIDRKKEYLITQSEIDSLKGL
jgi:outer membrane protein